MSIVKIEIESPACEERIGELHNNLASAGQALREDEFETFLLKVVGQDGKMIAGCKGEIAFRSAHISELWVDESHRGQGLGRKLLGYAESHAKAQHCIRVHLETRNSKARELYEHLGYAVFGSLPDYEGGNAFYYLEKRLA